MTVYDGRQQISLGNQVIEKSTLTFNVLAAQVHIMPD
jgi:hypothetical protein